MGLRDSEERGSRNIKCETTPKGFAMTRVSEKNWHPEEVAQRASELFPNMKDVESGN